MHLYLALLFSCAPPGLLLDTGATDEEVDLSRFIPLMEAVEADLEASSALGASVAVMEGGEITFAGTFGTTRADADVPPEPTTLFQVGSTTKMTTAAALLQKLSAGGISVHASLEDTLPDLSFQRGPSWSSEITLHHLLTHQGGFYDYVPWTEDSSDDALADWTYGYFADTIFVMADPGSFWNYSNPNFVLAGLVTEAMDERPWPDIMREDLYRPLGMERTVLRKREVEEDGDWSESYGYTQGSLSHGIQQAVSLGDVPDPGWARPAGLAWSTPTEMLLFARFLMEGDPLVLDNAALGELVSEQVNTLYYEDDLHYGYGVMVGRGIRSGDEYYRTPVWFHGGNTLSFSSALYILPEQDLAISILSSGFADDFSSSLATALSTLAEGLPEPEAPMELPFDPDGLDAHVGTYMDPWNVGEVVIQRDGDGLTIEMPLLEQYGYAVTPELVPASTDIWYVSIDGAWYDLTFISDPAQDPGAPSRWIRNRIYVAARAEGLLAPAAPAPSREQVAIALARARSHSLVSPAPPPRAR